MSSHPIVEITEAALAGLGSDLLPDADLELVALIVEKAGDALRAGIGVSEPLSKWLRRLSEDELASVVAGSLRTLNDVGLPGAPAEIEALEVAVVARDRSESVAAAVRRACIGAGRVAGTVQGFTDLIAAQASFDDRLGQHVDGTDVEAALGIRCGLLGASSWTATLPAAEVVVDESSPLDLSLDLSGASSPDAGEPSSSAVVSYIQDGQVASWVEGFAAAHEPFAEQLLGTVASFRDARETVSFVARAWQAQRSRVAVSAGESPSIVRIGIDVPMAAADDETVAEARRIRLGKLTPTDAEARLTLRGSRLTLRVLADAGSLPVVRLDEHEVPAIEPEVWSLEVPWTSEPMLLVIEDDAGRRFEGQFVIDPGSDAS